MPPQIPSTPGLLIEDDTHAIVMRIHNPDRANAITDDILRAIVRRVERPRPDVRVIVLTLSLIHI